jgi:ligand-binding sensor domain-containing protein
MEKPLQILKIIKTEIALMKNIQIFTIALLLSVTSSSLKSQTINSVPMLTKSIGTTNAPQSITRNVLQDKKGNIWMATWEGLIRYDGKSFQNFTKMVTPSRFFSIIEDSKGNLWCGTIGGGVFRYNGKSFENFTTKEGLINNEVTSIYEDNKGNIWFGASGGASCYDGKSFRNYFLDGEEMKEDLSGKVVFNERQPYEVNSIIEDKSGKFWFATRGNTFVYNPLAKPKGKEKKFTVFTHDNKAFKNVRTLIEDKKGNIWLTGNDGLWRYNGSTFTNFNKNFVGYVIEDKKGNIWTSSEKDRSKWVLSKYDAKTLSNKNPTVTEIAYQSMIFGILEDDKGNIWFGANGVYSYDGKKVIEFKNNESNK